MFALDTLSKHVPVSPDAASSRWSRFAAAWFGGVGFLAPVALFVSVGAYNTVVAPGALRVGSPAIVGTIVRLGGAAAFAGVVGGVTWHLLVERLDSGRPRVMGAIAGVLTSLLAVPPFLFVEFLVLSTGTYDVASAAIGAVYFGALSVFIVGWLTIPLGAIAGVVLGSIRMAE